jgi:hypothetical protein
MMSCWATQWNIDLERQPVPAASAVGPGFVAIFDFNEKMRSKCDPM